MSSYPYLNVWLQCLLQLAPPRGLVHIGAGGDARQYPFASMPRLLAVEADAQQHARLNAQLHNHACCQVMQAVVAGQPGTADFYTLSQSLESGLCAPAALQALWPNIKALRAETLPAITLQTLLEQTPDGAAAYNWAVIDCLPADELLKGAGELIHRWDVLVVRALKDAPIPTNTAVQGTSLPALREQLAAFGLEFVAMEEENHPKMVRALFVRNPTQQIAKDKAELTAARDAQTKRATESQSALTALQTQHDSLAQEKSKLIADSADLAKARDQLGIQKESEAKAKAEALAQRDAETKAKTEAIAQRDAEAKAKSEAIAQRDALAKDKAALTTARDEQAKLATERQTGLTALQTQQDRLHQEKVKLIADSEELERARDQLGMQKEAEVKARVEAISQRDAEAKAKAEALAQRDVEVKARAEVNAQRDAETKAKTDAINQRDAEAKAKIDAIAQRDALANDKAALTAARDEQAKLAAERQTALATQQKDSGSNLQRLQQLEADNQEYAARQHMLQEELIKAEAQIDLIKDLLLREPGL
ncbi:hypothetical protein [Rhodoferax sp. PAMC 29310]|uniref:hypothetical protein n=1 Tax=Rhodoferax sp. PAMC 29310 TaxID=2822760 RepID=UPI001B3295F3|nr:hypothetical protein [Rhodoferax sp. PAMC 29310]